jgi:glutamyl-tRNA reductase
VKKGIKLDILATPIRLNNKNFTMKHALNKLLKFMKILKHLRFIMKQINLSKLAKIINKADIVFLATKRINGRTPHV